MPDTMQFLYRITPVRPAMVQGPNAQEAAVLGEHVRYLNDLAERGVVQLAGRTQTADPDTFGIVVFRAESEEAARVIMEADPAVRGGLMRAELFPYRIAVAGTI
jgi:uncharacterized protein YciI